ncbi:MAG: outer membrane beta-barrel protein [Verrucomicrobiota bacterium]|nr:outer membrane beta-barrel protein [Verrucomicrobiota bacterium]
MKKLSVKNETQFNKWTLGLAAVGAVSLASAVQAQQTPTMSQVQTALSSTTLSGYVDTAAIWRPGTDTGSGGVNTPIYSSAGGTSLNDGFRLNSVDLALDKPLDESQWAAGYHVEFMLGPDAVPAVGGPGPGIRQAYLALRTPIGNGITWKVGVWDTIIGYESSSDPLNPNFTRSYGYGIEPTTHTGILGTYQVNDEVSLSAGVADDSNISGGVGVNALHSESQKAYMGSIALTAPGSLGFMKGATLTLGAIDTAGHVSTAPGSTSFYAGLTMPTPISALKVGAAFDYLDLHDGTGVGTANPSNNSAWVAGLYSSYQATDKLSLNLRGEYLADDGAGLYGSAAEEVTATAQYNLWANVISRLEFRWDHAETGAFGTSGTRKNDFLLALNLIYQF